MKSSYKLCLLFINPARLIAKTVSLARPAEFIKYITPLADDIIITHHRSRNSWVHHLKSMTYPSKPSLPSSKTVYSGFGNPQEFTKNERDRRAQHLEKRTGNAGCQGTGAQLQAKTKQAERGGGMELEKCRNRGEPGQNVLPRATLGGMN